MYKCDSGTTKKAEHRRTEAFELWCWRRLLTVPWTARRSNQSILKEINLEYSIGRTDAEASILWPPDAKSQLTGKDLDAGKDWGQEEKEARGWDGWMASLTRWTWVWTNSRSWWWTGRPGVLQSMGSQRVRHDWVTDQQQSCGFWESSLQTWMQTGARSWGLRSNKRYETFCNLMYILFYMWTQIFHNWYVLLLSGSHCNTRLILVLL